jgi:hypothetical protein
MRARHRRQPGTRRVRGWVTPALAVGLLAAGCTPHQDGTNRTAPATVAASSNAASGGGVEAEVLAAYRGMWAAFVAAARTSDPDAADLRRYTSGDALRLIVMSLYVKRERQRVILGDLRIDPHVSTVTDTTATVLDCVNDENWLVYHASGAPVDDTPGGRHRTTATVTRTGDGWRVTWFRLEVSGTC